MAVKIQDRQSPILVKEMCLGSTKPYTYSKEEILSMGQTPLEDKPYYTVKRPKEVLERAMDMLKFCPLVLEHVPNELTSDNFKDHIIGVVGNKLEMRKMDDGYWGIFGEGCVYSQDAVDYVKNGGNMTSCDYVSVWAPCKDYEADYELLEIKSINNVAITSAGRGGASVKIADSLFGWRDKMAGKPGLLSFLTNGSKTKDSKFKLSSVIFGGLKTLHTLDAAGKEKLVGDIMSHITPLGECKEKEYLIGAVKDAFSDPAVALKEEEKVSSAFDALYDRCTDSVMKDAEEILKGITKDAPKDENDGKKADGDGDKDDEKKKKEEEKKTKDSPTDISALVDAAVEKALTSTKDSIAGMIDASVKKALGLPAEDGKKKEEGADGKLQDSVLDDITREEGAFLLRSTFGR